MTTLNEVFQGLQAHYDLYNLRDDYVRVYKKVLGTVDPEQLDKAALHWMRNSEYGYRFPKPRDLLKIIKELPEMERMEFFADPEKNSARKRYWQAMSVLNDSFIGEADPNDLERFPLAFPIICGREMSEKERAA